MPEISKIKLILNQEEDDTYDIKDAEVRDILDILLGTEQQEESSD